MASISNIFGYILNFIYDIVKNYGLAIILFSVLLKVILLPLSIKQQKTMKKTAKMQGKVKEIQDKYKSNPEQMNREVMDLYKRENMSPFSGCLSSILQIVILFAMFYLVRSPLTYMKKIDAQVLETYKTQIQQENGSAAISSAYPEISIIKYINSKINNKESLENSDMQVDEEVYINMNFLGLDLSNIPKENYQDVTVYIIPVLYVITTIISMNLTMKTTKQNNKSGNEQDMTAQMNKNMSWLMPIMSVSISLIAPLGLALYWLINNILMICERLIVDKILRSKEEEQHE